MRRVSQPSASKSAVYTGTGNRRLTNTIEAWSSNRSSGDHSMRMRRGVRTVKRAWPAWTTAAGSATGSRGGTVCALAAPTHTASATAVTDKAPEAMTYRPPPGRTTCGTSIFMRDPRDSAVSASISEPYARRSASS